MNGIRLTGVSKVYDGEAILNNLDLTIPAGKFFVLLGPSGCGKTTILRLIGGFESVTSGSIYVDGHDVTNVPTNQRSVNTVFQNYALFPHLNVFDNVAYSLSVRGVDQKNIRERVEKVLKTVRLEKHSNKSIQALSGGQQQRVALARAIINNPNVLLLDEPLAALDQALKERMLVELMDLQEALQTTFVYVTHDQNEALTMADQIAILNADGEIEQIGTPKEVYEFPNNSFVASFVGVTNLFEGVLEFVEDSSELVCQKVGTFTVPAARHKEWVQDGASVVLSVRPEKIYISKKTEEGFSNHLSGIVNNIIYHGRSTQYIVELPSGKKVQVFEQNDEHFPKEVITYDDQVNLYWQRDNALLLQR